MVQHQKEPEVLVKEVVDLVVTEGPRVGVCNDISVGTNQVSVASLYFVSSLFLRNSTSIFRKSVEDTGATSTSFLACVGALSLLHNSVIRIRNGRDVWCFFARMLIFKA